MELILAEAAVSVTELKRNCQAALKTARARPVAVLNHNRPEAYLISPALFEACQELLDDLEDAGLVQGREAEPTVKVAWDDL